MWINCSFVACDSSVHSIVGILNSGSIMFLPQSNGYRFSRQRGARMHLSMLPILATAPGSVGFVYLLSIVVDSMDPFKYCISILLDKVMEQY